MSEYFIDNIGSRTNGKSMVPSLLLEKFHSLEKCFANFGMEIVDANDEVNDGKKQCNIAIDIRYKKKYAIEKEDDLQEDDSKVINFLFYSRIIGNV